MSTTTGQAATTPTVTPSTPGQLMQIVAQPPPPFLQCPGEPAIPYETWARMYENFELLGGFSQLDDAIRRAHFIASLGNEGQRVFFNLDVADDTLAASKEAVRCHYVAQTCEEIERYKFKARGQLKEESVDDFVAELRRLLVGCNYGRYSADCERDMLRDQIVEKVYDSKVRERLLLRANELSRRSKRMTLQDAIDIVRVAETVKRESSLIEDKSSSTVGGGENPSVNKVSSSWSKSSQPTKATTDNRVSNRSRCYACNRSGHRHDDPICKARTRRCNECEQLGHYANSKLCKGKVECNFVDQTNVDVFTVGDRCSKIMINANISSVKNSNVVHEFKFQIDTGSNVSILPYEMYESHFSDALVPAPRLLSDYSGRVIPVEGCLEANVVVQGKLCRTKLYVVEKGALILGLDVMRSTDFDLSQVLEISDKAATPRGVTKFKHRIKLKADAKPCVQKYRAPPYAVRDKVRDELSRLVSEGIIESIDSSEWVSPL